MRWFGGTVNRAGAEEFDRYIAAGSHVPKADETFRTLRDVFLLTIAGGTIIVKIQLCSPSYHSAVESNALERRSR